jgi:ATP-dependent RNA helicase RhlE
MGELRGIQKVTGLSLPVGHGEPWERLDAPSRGTKRGGSGKPARRPRRSRPRRNAA